MVTHKAKAGYVAGYGAPDYISSLPVFHMPLLPPDKKFRMFSVSVDSMLPVLEGAHVIVEYIQDWQGNKDGMACVVITKNDGIVFMVVYTRIATDRALTLVSLNSLYEPYDIDIAEVVEIWKYNSYWTDGKLYPQLNREQILSAIDELRQKLVGN